MGPCFYERQKMKLNPQNLINWEASTLGAPFFSYFVGALFDQGPSLKGLSLKEGPHKMRPCFHERQKIESCQSNSTSHSDADLKIGALSGNMFF
jgi:hypothetical protein